MRFVGYAASLYTLVPIGALAMSARTATNIANPPRELVRRVKDGKPLVLFAGSGISATADVRTGEDLAAQLRKERPRAFRGHGELSYSEVFRKAIPRVEDRRARVEKECLGRLPQSEHLWVAQFIKHRHLRAVVTTNFDHLIEHALMRVCCEGIPVILNEDELHPGLWPPEIPPIVKIHGDFLFDDIANLTEELQNKLRENMRHALLGMTAGADLLVVGYGGSDDTVMSLIGEIVRNRSSAETRVWWSRYGDAEPTGLSLLGQLAASAERARNPITWLGPWPAATCFRSLGKAIGVPKPVPVTFGITGAMITPPTHFAQPLQRLAGSAEKRSTALAEHARLKEWVQQGGVILVLQKPGAGGSTLLAAIAEAAQQCGLYWDIRFGLRPLHVDLQWHVWALELQLGVNSLVQLFQRGAVVAVDGIELRTTTGPFLETNLLRALESLTRAQRTAGKGTLVLGTHLSPAELRALRSSATWLPNEDRTCRLHAGDDGKRRPSIPRNVEPLLNVLGLAATAMPRRAALRAADLSSPFEWRSVERWVECRGERATLREVIYRERRPRLRGKGALAGRLADALEQELDEVHPLRRLGLALEAEALYFDHAEDSLKALSVFLSVAEAGLAYPPTQQYFRATLVDHLNQGIEDPGLWRRLPTLSAQMLAELAVDLWCDVGGPPSKEGLLGLTLNVLLHGRNYVDRELIELPLRLRKVREASDAQDVGKKLCEILPGLKQAYGRARRAGMFAASRARLALSIGAVWDQVGDQTSTTSAYQSGLKWSRCAKREVGRARGNETAGHATDNEVGGLLKLGRLDDAASTLKKRLAELGKREAFSHEKAVAYSNLLHLALKRGELERAEACFFEAVLQCVVLQRWHGLFANLNLLERFAEEGSRLPKPKLIAETKNALQVTHLIWPF